MWSRPLVHKLSCTVDHGNYQGSWILVCQLMVYFFFFKLETSLLVLNHKYMY